MASKTSPPKPPPWSQLKNRLAAWEKPALIELIHQLYQMNADNKVFLTSRLTEVDVTALAEPYRKVIQETFNPKRGFPSLNLRSARKAVNDFKKACNDPAAVADLMIFYVEQGVACTNNYGDIHESFYNSLESVYAEAIKVIKSGDPELVEHFRPRMGRIVTNTSSIGWGFHDELSALYEEEYPSDPELTDIAI